MNEAELDALMDRLADGDRAAFDPLHAELWPRALRLARARLGDANAEDAAQSTLLRVFSRAAEFERGRPVLPWFYAIASNEIRAIQRRARPAPALDERAAEGTPEDELGHRELRRALDRAIADLDDDAAEAILAMLERAPRPDATPATFRKRVSRAYARLRLILGGAHGR
ncbi:MAG TPA: sigma factor [Polyangiaceae bacterium]